MRRRRACPTGRPSTPQQPISGLQPWSWALTVESGVLQHPNSGDPGHTRWPRQVISTPHSRTIATSATIGTSRVPRSFNTPQPISELRSGTNVAAPDCTRAPSTPCNLLASRRVDTIPHSFHSSPSRDNSSVTQTGNLAYSAPAEIRAPEHGSIPIRIVNDQVPDTISRRD